MFICFCFMQEHLRASQISLLHHSVYVRVSCKDGRRTNKVDDRTVERPLKQKTLGTATWVQYLCYRQSTSLCSQWLAVIYYALAIEFHLGTDDAAILATVLKKDGLLTNKEDKA